MWLEYLRGKPPEWHLGRLIISLGDIMQKFLLLLAALAASQSALAAPAPAIDNECVTVWDINLAPGASAPPLPADNDRVVMFLEGGRIKTVTDGKARTTARKFGDAMLIPKGSTAIDTLISGSPAHEIVVALKDHAEPATLNTGWLWWCSGRRSSAGCG